MVYTGINIQYSKVTNVKSKLNRSNASLKFVQLWVGTGLRCAVEKMLFVIFAATNTVAEFAKLLKSVGKTKISNRIIYLLIIKS